MKNALLGLIVATDSCIALASTVPCEGPLCSLAEKFPSVGLILVYIVGFQLALRGLAEALIFISAKTETETDNKVAAWVSQASWVLGNLLAKFGYSVPKAVIEEKAIELAQKPLSETVEKK